MAYVRKKKTKSGEYYQLVEGRREGGKVRQKVLAHLGDCPSAKAALKRWPRQIIKLREAIDRLRHGSEHKRSLMAKDLTEERKEGRRDHSLRFVDEDGNMRRRKYSPHEIKETYISNNDLPGYGHGSNLTTLYACWQYEYWQEMDHADRLERWADELEGRYIKLRAVFGDGPDEARRGIQDEGARCEEIRTRWTNRHMSRREKAAALLHEHGLTNLAR